MQKHFVVMTCLRKRFRIANAQPY